MLWPSRFQSARFIGDFSNKQSLRIWEAFLNQSTRLHAALDFFFFARFEVGGIAEEIDGLR